ncbi:MAG: hypothetical protein JWN40_508 [Phycisphaerales bacterium]|nr:hypothetical protein [Phycisphaerales bacterium]
MDDDTQHNRGQWVYVNAKNGADQLVMRLRIDRPPDDDIDSYSTAVVIKWEYPSQLGTASPPADVLQQMEVFGEAVVGLAWATGCSYLMNIATGLGTREWCYYTRDRAEFMRRFNALLVGHNRYPLRIEFLDDPQWKLWLNLRYAYERAGGASA